MTEKSNQDENSSLHASAKQSGQTATITNDSVGVDATPPLISAYVTDAKITPSAFSKALKASKTKYFKREDESKALAALESGDPGGERLWALMSQAILPDAVDRWIWIATQKRLREVIGPDFDLHETNSNTLLKTLCEVLTPLLKSKEKSETIDALNWLRIGICWLIEKRSISAWAVAEFVAPVFFADDRNASRLVGRAISKGRTKELKLAVATVVLGKAIVARAELDRDEERRRSTGLRLHLSDAKQNIEVLSAKLAAACEDLARKKDALEKTETMLDNERQHWGHDLSNTKGDQRVFLTERVRPLLNDALDALEIEPPAPHVALNRIKVVLSIIDEATP